MNIDLRRLNTFGGTSVTRLLVLALQMRRLFSWNLTLCVLRIIAAITVNRPLFWTVDRVSKGFASFNLNFSISFSHTYSIGKLSQKTGNIIRIVYFTNLRVYFIRASLRSRIKLALLSTFVVFNNAFEWFIFDFLRKVRVESVLDRIVSPARNILSDAAPLIAENAIQSYYFHIFFYCPCIFADIWIQVNVPTFSTLFSNAARQTFCNFTPVAKPMIVDKLDQYFVFGFCPNTTVTADIVQLHPSHVAFYLRFP